MKSVRFKTRWICAFLYRKHFFFLDSMVLRKLIRWKVHIVVNRNDKLHDEVWLDDVGIMDARACGGSYINALVFTIELVYYTGNSDKYSLSQSYELSLQYLCDLYEMDVFARIIRKRWTKGCTKRGKRGW